MRSHILLWLLLGVLLLSPAVNAEEPEYEEEDFGVSCEDKDEHCDMWAARGECNVNPGFMHVQCQKSCGMCTQYGSELLPPHVRHHRGADLGVLQQIMLFDDGTREVDILWLIGKARNYMYHVADHEMHGICKNKNSKCAWWALLGECTSRNSECKSIKICRYGSIASRFLSKCDAMSTDMFEECGPICSACEHHINST